MEPTGSDAGPASRPDGGARVPVAIEEAIAAAAMAAIVLIMFANVVVRYLTDESFAFTEEFSVFLMVVLAFAGASAAFAKNSHIRVTFFAEKLAPRPAAAIELGAMAVTIAGSSGILGTLAEAFKTTSALVEGMRSDNPLVRAICQRDDLVAAQKGLKEKFGELRSGDLANAQNRIRLGALDSVRRALEIVAARGPEDVDAYRGFLRDLAVKVANAAKEGSFLGFGGERVSEGERTMLHALDSALAEARA